MKQDLVNLLDYLSDAKERLAKEKEDFDQLLAQRGYEDFMSWYAEKVVRCEIKTAEAKFWTEYEGEDLEKELVAWTRRLLEDVLNFDLATSTNQVSNLMTGARNKAKKEMAQLYVDTLTRCGYEFRIKAGGLIHLGVEVSHVTRIGEVS